MSFQTATPERIASISQRALLLYWQHLAAGRPYPTAAEFTPSERTHDLKQLVTWQVEHDGARRVFRATHHGAHVAEVFGQQWLGRTMDEVVPAFGRRSLCPGRAQRGPVGVLCASLRSLR